jgi:hypothetical protein
MTPFDLRRIRSAPHEREYRISRQWRQLDVTGRRRVDPRNLVDFP